MDTSQNADLEKPEDSIVYIPATYKDGVLRVYYKYPSKPVPKFTPIRWSEDEPYPGFRKT